MLAFTSPSRSASEEILEPVTLRSWNFIVLRELLAILPSVTVKSSSLPPSRVPSDISSLVIVPARICSAPIALSAISAPVIVSFKILAAVTELLPNLAEVICWAPMLLVAIV